MGMRPVESRAARSMLYAIVEPSVATRRPRRSARLWTRAGSAGSASTYGAPPSASPPHTSTRAVRSCARRLVHRQSASLQAWEGTALMITIQVDECFSGGHPDFAPAPLRHDLMVLAPNPLSVLAD